jgi:hypothetical protein
MSMTSSNGVTGSLATPRQRFGEGALKSTGSPPSCRRPPHRRVHITTLRGADRPRRHHSACRSTPLTSKRSLRSSHSHCPNDDHARTRGSSSARCPTGPSNAPNTATGPSQPSRPRTPSQS